LVQKYVYCYLAVIVFSGFIVLAESCSSHNSNSYPDPPGYNFSKPYVYKLPTTLDEILGPGFYPKDSGIFAIQDEKGWLFKIHLKTRCKLKDGNFQPGRLRRSFTDRQRFFCFKKQRHP